MKTVDDFKDLVGRSVDEAKKMLPEKYTIFVATEDGDSFYRTMEFNPFRINVWVKRGKITHIDSLS
jgi:hypothetical protein